MGVAKRAKVDISEILFGKINAKVAFIWMLTEL